LSHFRVSENNIIEESSRALDRTTRDNFMTAFAAVDTVFNRRNLRFNRKQPKLEMPWLNG
jgi:hypothetical protein